MQEQSRLAKVGQATVQPMPGASQESILKEVQTMALMGAESMQGDFIAGIAHELRNPLNQLQGAHDVLCSLVEKGYSETESPANTHDDPRLQQAMNLSARGLLRVEELLAELHQFADIPHLIGDDSIEPTHVIRQIFLDIEMRSKAEGILLVLEENLSDGLRIAISERGLWRMVMPLINNALQALQGSSRPILKVSATEQGSPSRRVMRIRVEDNGSGIDEALGLRVFEPFVSGWDIRGLGLSLVKALNVAMGGSLECSSSAAGAVFLLEVPLC